MFCAGPCKRAWYAPDPHPPTRLTRTRPLTHVAPQGKKVVREVVWSVDDSLFAQRKKENEARDLYDTDKVRLGRGWVDEGDQNCKSIQGMALYHGSCPALLWASLVCTTQTRYGTALFALPYRSACSS